MVEAYIGGAIIVTLFFTACYIHKNGLHLSPYDRALRAIDQCENFALNPGTVTLVKSASDPVAFSGFALDDGSRKLLCFHEAPGLICDYDQILEWRILVNHRSVACLSRLSSIDLRVDEPQRELGTEAFLRQYCCDERQNPLLETVVVKFLLRNLSYPVHSFSMHSVDHGPGELQQGLQAALAQIDKFKIIMYRG